MKVSSPLELNALVAAADKFRNAGLITIPTWQNMISAIRKAGREKGYIEQASGLWEEPTKES